MSLFATDLLRIISVTFIMFNHVSWPFYARNGSVSETPFDIGVAIVNQLGKPSVLVFIFLSGLAFARHRINSEFSAVKFYKNRAGRLLPPYILISLLAIYFFDTVKTEDIPMAFLTGGAMYHLYFVALISYCYLLFPLMRSIKPTKLNFSMLFICFTILQVTLAVFVPESANPVIIKYARNLFSISYTLDIDKTIVLWIEFLSFAILFFQAGIWIGRSTDKHRERDTGFYSITSVIMISAFIMVFADFIIRIHAGVHADASGRTWRMSVLLYALTWIFLLRNVNRNKSNPAMRRLARASFLVYLIHPLLINFTKTVGYDYPIIYAALIIASSWSVALTLQHLALKFHLAGFFLGEGDKIMEKRSQTVLNTQQQA